MGGFSVMSLHSHDSDATWKVGPWLGTDEFGRGPICVLIMFAFKVVVVMLLFKFVIAFVMDAYKATNPKKRQKTKDVVNDLTWLSWYNKGHLGGGKLVFRLLGHLILKLVVRDGCCRVVLVLVDISVVLLALFSLSSASR